MTQKLGVTASAPSNIAFVKYWGKRDPEKQWPANDSLSMTLSTSRSITSARLSGRDYDSFTFAGQTLRSSGHPDHKVWRHLDRVRSLTGSSARLDIQSINTFPTGCGIASSASGFAALTIASAAALTGSRSFDELGARGIGLTALANCARQGSGSAGRSLFDGFVRWSAGPNPEEQSIVREQPFDHWNLADVIVVLSDEEKAVSSSQAHLAAWSSPLFSARLAGIPERLHAVIEAIRSKDLMTVGTQIEADALEMHAVAMTGSPRICYLSRQTQDFIAWVRCERRHGRLKAWFTIDAGPNVHLICQAVDAPSVIDSVRNKWPEAGIIADKIGSGPTLRGCEEGVFND
jgi:diphosphomevalonate decarboxylase